VESLLNAALSNALVATALAVLAAGVGRWCRRPALVHTLWLLVLAKLLTPPLVPVPVSWPRAWKLSVTDMGVAEYAPSASVAAVSEKPAAAGAGGPDPVAAQPISAKTSDLPATAEDGGFGDGAALLAPLAVMTLNPFVPEHAPRDVAPLPPASRAEPEPALGIPSMPWPATLVLVWLAGSALWLGITVRRVCRFRRSLRCAVSAPDDLRAEVRSVARLLGLSRCPAVWLVPGRVSPLVWTLGGRPSLFLPTALWSRLTQEQRTTLLAHELAHLRRHDPWVRILELAACGLYWWHPVVWWASRRLREAEEQCCDAWVVWALPRSSRAYATALVEVVDFLADSRAALPVVASGIGHVHDLKRRLTMILRGTTPHVLSTSGLATVLVLAATLLPFVPTWGQEPQEDRNDDKQEKVEGQKRRAEEERDRAEKQKRDAEQRRTEQERARQQRREAQRKRAEELRARARRTQEESSRGQETAEMRRFESDIRRLTSDLERRRQELRATEERLERARKQLDDHRRAWEERREQARRQEEEERRSTPPTPPTARPRGESPSRRAPESGERGSSDQDRRLRDLERRLDGLLDEIRSLRRDMRRPGGPAREPGRPGAGAGGPPGDGVSFTAPALAPVATPPPVAQAAPALAPLPVNPAPPAVAPAASPPPANPTPPSVAPVAPAPPALPGATPAVGPAPAPQAAPALPPLPPPATDRDG
jgi:beta-lactamase regulating signal transducer with metallopeptidase domain